MVFQMKVSSISQEGLFCIQHTYSITAFAFFGSWHLGRRQIRNSAKPSKDPKFPPNLHLLSLSSTTGKLSEKLISRTIQKHIEERNLLDGSQFGFEADHSMTLQCLRLAITSP
jgi:hypothetical protein